MATIRPISQRKREANRHNAQQSTGPTSPEGKQRSSRNALKHGLLAREIVVDAGDGKENRTEFNELLVALADELKPVGVLEGLCVQEIAVCIWRKRRACRFENGAIRDGADTMKRSHEEFADTEGNSVRLQARLDQLAEVEAALSKGHITGEPAPWIREHLGSSYPDPAGRTPVGQPYVKLSDEAVAALRKDIAAERERLLALQTQALEIEKLLVDAAVKRAALPGDPWLNTLLRYEAANDKQLQRALERLTPVAASAPGGGSCAKNRRH